MEDRDKEQLAVDPLESMSLAEPNKSTYVSSLLSGAEKDQLRQVLLRNMDVFAWTHSDMAGINLIDASHKLNVIPSARLVRHKIMRFHPDRYQVIQAEVDNLLEAGFIREVKYPKWFANVVVVPKKGGKMESVRGLHRSQRGMPERQFPSTPNIPDRRCVSKAWDVVISGRLLGISSNTHASARRGENILHHPVRPVLLQCNAVWLKKCWGNLSEASSQNVQAITWKDHGGLVQAPDHRLVPYSTQLADPNQIWGNAVLTFISNPNTKKKKVNTNVNTFSIPNTIKILIGYT